MSTSVIQLACLPNLAEATIDACLAVALFGMPWTFAFMLGFIMSAVSPAVVVPSLLRLKEQNYGTKNIFLIWFLLLLLSTMCCLLVDLVYVLA